MEHVIIGNLHERDVWKRVDFAYYQKAVFLGDYVDTLVLRSQIVISKHIKR